MNKFITGMLLLLVMYGSAQVPDDVLRLGWQTGFGSARNRAVGGIMGTLGGDLSAAHANPAGIGFYRTGEFSLGLGVNSLNNQYNFRQTDTNYVRTIGNYNLIGVVFPFATGNTDSKIQSGAISLTLSQMASFNNRLSFNGYNNYSSFTEQYLEELTGDLADTNAALNNYIFGSSLAFRTYLIDTSLNQAGQFTGYKTLVPVGSGVWQRYDAVTKGGLHEAAVTLALNQNEKWYWGASLIIPFVKYSRTLNYSETDATNNTQNQFASFQYYENFSSSGVGVGLKLGCIYKPAPYIRLGMAFHTPQSIGMNDYIRSSLTANTETYAGTRTETSDNLNDGLSGNRKYTIVTPWRLLLSGSYIFRELADTRKQKAFIGADIEYVNYRSGRVRTAEGDNAVAENYLNAVNGAVKNNYRGNFNIRVGAELKMNIWMLRGGFAYYGSPYATALLSKGRTNVSAGIGYRNKGFFVDATYVWSIQKEAVFPYRLADKANTFAAQQLTNQQVQLTFGVKF